jgi:hypothetical protein
MFACMMYFHRVSEVQIPTDEHEKMNSRLQNLCVKNSLRSLHFLDLFILAYSAQPNFSAQVEPKHKLVHKHNPA